MVPTKVWEPQRSHVDKALADFIGGEVPSFSLEETPCLGFSTAVIIENQNRVSVPAPHTREFHRETILDSYVSLFRDFCV